jgi:hypothetical protein
MLFDPHPRFNTRHLDFLSGFALPDEPTQALPGSEQKLAVLRKRLRQRVALHHPDDLANVVRGWRLLAAIRGLR